MEQKTHTSTRRANKRVARRGKGTNNTYNTNRIDSRGTLTTSVRSNLAPLVIEPWMPIFPARIVKRLRYSTTFTLGAVAGAVSSYVFRANDLFDPDFTGTGHQPMGFDQLMLFYNHFCVVRAHLTCTFLNTASAASSICIRQDASSSPITVIDRIIELGGNVKADLEFKSVNGSMRTLDLGLDMAKLQGVSQSAITADSTLRGDAATSPTEVTYFHVQAWSTIAATNAIQIDAILEQEAVFMEPRDNIES